MSPAAPDDAPVLSAFADLGLAPILLQTLSAVGYETPSPIQAATIPPLLAGRDMVGQAQTGTGKTAAFALPILSRLDFTRTKPQALVLAPTRELAIQVAEAFQRYASNLPGFHVLPIYGGQSYGPQLSGLKRGVHVIVGTPGRVIDHLERGSLDLSQLTTLVLDEADEMLRMGFIDDVEAVLKKTPPERQIALFSATMPAPIRRIAQTYLRDPAEITIKAKTTTATNIRQRYWYVSGLHKLDALTRILEAEPFEAMIVFTRTKQGTEELAQKLQARGFAAAAINGDIVQAQRERTIQQLKDGKLDILVATDVAARGLDVERISHVLNFDIPHDTEAYVHRIGRTGRAGRSGEAILFVSPREKRLLQAIERATRQPIAEMQLPSVQMVNDQRIAKFKQRIGDTLASGGLEEFRQLIEQYEQEHNIPAVEVAAALARMAQGDVPLLLEPPPPPSRAFRDGNERTERGPRSRDASGYANERGARRDDRPHARDAERGPRPPRGDTRNAPPARADASDARTAAPPPRTARPHPTFAPPPAATPSAAAASAGAESPSGADVRHDGAAAPRRDTERRAPASHHREETARPRTRRDSGAHVPDAGLETFRIEVGEMHGVKPGNIVGAIANEAGLDSKHIGRVDIREDHSLVDLPEGMPAEIFKHLKKVWVSGQQLRITRGGEDADLARKPASRKPPSFAKAGHEKPAGFDRKPGFAKKPGFEKRFADKKHGFEKPKRPSK